MADANVIDQGIQAAVESTEPLAEMPTYEIQEVLEHCVARFKERFD